MTDGNLHESGGRARALAGLTVLECSTGVAGGYCGRLFALYGARVLAITESDVPSAIGLDSGAVAVGEKALSIYLGAGKETITRTALAGDALERLLSSADVVITDERWPQWVAASSEALRSRYPNLIVIHISPFGLSGPYAGYAALPGTLYALGGYSYMTGDASREPLNGPEHIPAYMAGAHAYVGAMAALLARARDGQGQSVEVSAMESLASAHQWTITRYSYNGRIQPRNGNRYDSLHPVTYYRCADGTVAVAPSTPDQLERLLLLLGREDLFADPRFTTNFARIENADSFDTEVAPWFLGRSRAEITRECQAYRVPVAPALEIDELLTHEQLEARGFWRPIIGPGGARLLLPGPPFRMPLSSLDDSKATLGTEDHRAPSLVNAATGSVPSQKASRKAPPLAGIRILDLTRVWSGPFGARILADLGAEVIKVEHPAARGPSRITARTPDRVTFYPDNDPGQDPWNRNAAFNKMNRNKLSLSLDLAQSEGRQAFLELAAVSDAVIENYSPRVLGNLGIGFDSLHRVNQRLILVSMPGYGLDGPMRDSVAYGSILDAECGIASLMGYEGEGPQRLGVALPDPVAGLHAAAALLTALSQRQRIGEGQHIDLSQLESMANLVGGDLVAWQLTGERPKRPGNRHPGRVPHGIYRCAGHDAWVFIGVEDAAQWDALKGVLRDQRLLSERFATVAARKDHEDELDSLLSEWTSGHSPGEAMELLQAAGVPAGAVLDAAGLYHDQHLNARGFLVELEHATAGRHRYPGQAIHLSETPVEFISDAPLLGEHNQYVLHDLLGYGEEAIAKITEKKVIADRPPV